MFILKVKMLVKNKEHHLLMNVEEKLVMHSKTRDIIAVFKKEKKMELKKLCADI
jgi:hypothetical protein